MFEQPGAEAGGGNAGLMYNQLKKFIGVVVSNQSNKLFRRDRYAASHFLQPNTCSASELGFLQKLIAAALGPLSRFD